MRKASSMIELVFAIVIMGIALMALPLMLEQTTKNNEFSLQQEILLAARTKLGDTLTYRWDENSLNNDRIVVLRTDGDSELNPEANTTRRIGHIHGNKRRKFAFDNNATQTANFTLDTPFDDIDDFNTNDSNLTDSSETTNLDYRFIDFIMTTTVTYLEDNATYSNQIINNFTFNKDNNVSHSSNIKMLTLNVTSNNGVPFTLRTFSCNIGESEFLRRNY